MESNSKALRTILLFTQKETIIDNTNLTLPLQTCYKSTWRLCKWHQCVQLLSQFVRGKIHHWCWFWHHSEIKSTKFIMKSKGCCYHSRHWIVIWSLKCQHFGKLSEIHTYWNKSIRLWIYRYIQCLHLFVHCAQSCALKTRYLWKF